MSVPEAWLTQIEPGHLGPVAQGFKGKGVERSTKLITIAEDHEHKGVALVFEILQ